MLSWLGICIMYVYIYIFIYLYLYLYLYLFLFFIYIYIYIYICIYIYIYIYIYISCILDLLGTIFHSFLCIQNDIFNIIPKGHKTLYILHVFTSLDTGDCPGDIGEFEGTRHAQNPQH